MTQGRMWAARLGALVRQNRLVIAVALCAAVFLALLGEVLEGEIMRFDEAAFWLIVGHLRSDVLTPVMEAFSALATPMALIAMLLIVVAFAPGRRPGACCALNLVLVVALNQVLKELVQRPRPEGFRLAEVSGFSFPSGHSMAACAFFGLLAWMVWRYERDRVMRWGCSAAFVVLAVAVGVSRVYLGVHYASDVVAGFCVSIIWLVMYTRLVAPLFLDGEDGAAGGATGGAAGPSGPSR